MFTCERRAPHPSPVHARARPKARPSAAARRPISGAGDGRSPLNRKQRGRKLSSLDSKCDMKESPPLTMPKTLWQKCANNSRRCRDNLRQRKTARFRRSDVMMWLNRYGVNTSHCRLEFPPNSGCQKPVFTPFWSPESKFSRRVSSFRIWSTPSANRFTFSLPD